MGVVVEEVGRRLGDIEPQVRREIDDLMEDLPDLFRYASKRSIKIASVTVELFKQFEGAVNTPNSHSEEQFPV
ncbi:hypothetical protein P9112_006069 [Eukaryota sp. TZLM1-RC]